jgi:peptide/nickel transport system ATP-binding protein
VQAVNGVDLQVQRGEVVALIGESGSGKSVTLRSLLRLHPPRRTRSAARCRWPGSDVLALSPRELADYRGKVASMIFQEPLLALDPVYTVGAQIVESIRRHEPERQRGRGAPARAGAVRARAHPQPRAPPGRLPARDERRHAPARDDRAGPGLPAAGAAGRRAHHRARRHGADPDPAAAARAAARLGLSVIFVTHDIGAAVEVADRIAVMYAGRIVEEGPARS